jgi:hypothetical protein
MSFVNDLFGGSEPDYSGMNRAAERSAALGDRSFDWFTKEYARTAPDRQKAQQEASAITQAQLATMEQQNALAKDYSDYNKSTFRPLEQRMVADAQAYDTPERRKAEADAAVADVNSQVAQQRQATQMDLARSGVSPESMKSQALMASGDINAARLAAGAASGARSKVEATGYARMADAASLGRGLPSAQATAVQTGIQAGSAGLGASQAGLSAGMSGAGLMQTGFQQGLQGAGQAGSIFGKVGDLQSATRGQNLDFQARMFDSAMKGMGGMMASDPKVKKNRKVVKPADSMEGLRKTPIEDWQYDPTKGGPEDGDTVRTGPMADAANKNLGDDVAPNGEMLNVASMLGVVANSVKDVDARLSKLEQRKAA